MSSPYRQKVIETFRKRRVELRMPVEMPTIDAIKKFVAMGNGVALLPAITVEGEVAHKELVRVQVPELAFDRKLRLIHRREGTLSHAAEALLAVVEAQSRGSQEEGLPSPPSARYTYAFLPTGEGPDGSLSSGQACGSGGIGRRASLRS